MSDFVDATDPSAVEQVLARAVVGLGLTGLIEQLAAVPGLRMRQGRPAGLLRGAEPTVLEVGDQALAVAHDGAGELRHVVGGVVLSRDAVSPFQLPGVLAAMLVRSLQTSGAHDQLSVVLTSVRDAVG